MNNNMPRSFAFVINGEVIGTLTISNTNVEYDRWCAGLSSNPTIVEYPEDLQVQNGWTWDGESFTEGI
jgi:hypothetical protein